MIGPKVRRDGAVAPAWSGVSLMITGRNTGSAGGGVNSRFHRNNSGGVIP